jgi:hypothetical protein
MAEQPAPYLGEREDRDHMSRALGYKIMGGVAKDVLDDPLPAKAVKESPLGAGIHEPIPSGRIWGICAPHRER